MADGFKRIGEDVKAIALPMHRKSRQEEPE